MKSSSPYIICALICMLAVPMPARAQFAKRKDADVQVEEIKRRRTKGAGKNQLNRSAIFAVEVKKELIRGIDKTLSFYKRQVARLSKGSAARLNIMNRVLQLNLEQASYVRGEEERNYDRRWKAWNVSGRRGQEPKINIRKSTGHWRQVIAQADRIISEYPRNKTADEVLFKKGFAYSFIGKETESAKIYTQLIQKYPNSQVAGNAYSSLGDYYFDRADFRNARNNYEKSLRYRRSTQYLWSLFKLGWCYYNLGDNRKALSYWKNVVRLGGKGGQSATQLREEALRDMVYAFAELKDVKGAIAYYRANKGGEYIGSLLQLLAVELADDGNFPEAIKTYKLFQTLLPTSEQAPAAQKELLLLLYELGKLSTLWKEVAIMKRLYGGDGRWANANSKDRKLVLETRRLVKDQILYYAKVMHKRGQKSDNKTFYSQAKVGYIMFLQNFSKAREAVEVKYLLADIEFAMKDFRSAGKQYLEIVLRGKKEALIFQPNSAKVSENVHKKSAVYMVDAYARDFETEFKALQKRKADFSKPPRPLSLKAKNYVKACTTYLKFYPNDKKLEKTCEVDIARIYYFNNDKQNSRKYLWILATKYPNDAEVGPKAVRDLVPLYQDDKGKLLEVADRLLKFPAYQKGKLGEDLRAIRRGAEKESVAKVKEPIKRAKAYEALAKKHPNDPEADILLFKAGDNYLDGGDVGAAIGAYLLLVKKYPKSKVNKDSLLNVARLYESRLDFETSAAYYQAYSEKFRTDGKAAGALSKSCDLLLAVDSSKAKASCLALARAYPKQGVDVVERLIISAKRSKRYSEMASLTMSSYLKLNLTPNQRIVALHRISEVTQGRGSAAAQAESGILAEYRKAKGSVSGEALRYVGEILFKKANGSISRFLGLKLSGGTVDRLQKSIATKAAELEKLEAAYSVVTGAQDSFWGVAALHQVGVAYEQFSLLLESPPSIQGAKAGEVQKTLAPQAAQLRAAAMKYYTEAYGLVRKFKVYNDWSIKVINAFFRVNNSALSFSDHIVEPDFVGSEVPGSLVSELKVGGN